jgi:hypothetical protein
MVAEQMKEELDGGGVGAEVGLGVEVEGGTAGATSVSLSLTS